MFAATGSPVSRHAVAFVLFTVFLDMVGFGLITPVLPALIEDVGHVGLDRASIIGGWMFAAFSIAQFAFAPLAGNLADRFGRRPLLLIAIFGLGLDFALSAWAPTLTWLFVGRILTGICGSSWVIASAYLTDVTPPAGRARAFGWLTATYGLGFIIGPAIGGILGELGPRVPFWAAAALSLVNFVYGWAVLPESLPVESRRPFSLARANPFGTFAVFRRYPGVLPLCLVLGIYFFVTAVYASIWPFWGIARFGWSEALIGLTLMAYGVVTAAFQGTLTGTFVRRFGEHRTVVIGLVCSAIAATGYGLVGSLAGVLILTLAHGPEGFVHPLLTAMLTRRVPENAQGELQGGISAVLNIAMLGGTVFFAQVFGWFMAPGREWTSPSLGFLISGTGIVLTLGLYLFVRRQEQRRGGAGEQEAA